METPNEVKEQVEAVEKEAETAVKKGIHQGHFAVIFAALATIAIVVSFKYFAPGVEGGPAYGAAVRITSVAMQQLALWFVAATSFTAVLNGLKCNLYDEIVLQHNVAVSLLVVGGWLSIAHAIHG